MSEENDTASRLGRMEALQEANIRTMSELTNNVNRLVEKLDKSDDLAKEAAQSARSAHKRIDGHDRVIFWAATMIIGSLIAGGIALLWKGVEN